MMIIIASGITSAIVTVTVMRVYTNGLVKELEIMENRIDEKMLYVVSQHKITK